MGNCINPCAEEQFFLRNFLCRTAPDTYNFPCIVECEPNLNCNYSSSFDSASNRILICTKLIGYV